MARRKRRGGRGFRIGKWVNLGFKIAGVSVAMSPAIRAVKDHYNDPAVIPAYVFTNYTGVSVGPAGNTTFDSGMAAGGVASIIGGVVLAKLGSFLGRRF